MEKTRKLRQVVDSPNGHKYKVVLGKDRGFFHRQLHHDQKPVGPWRAGAPPEWTSHMLQEVFDGLEALAIKT